MTQKVPISPLGYRLMAWVSISVPWMIFLPAFRWEWVFVLIAVLPFLPVSLFPWLFLSFPVIQHFQNRIEKQERRYDSLVSDPRPVVPIRLNRKHNRV